MLPQRYVNDLNVYAPCTSIECEYTKALNSCDIKRAPCTVRRRFITVHTDIRSISEAKLLYVIVT